MTTCSTTIDQPSGQRPIEGLPGQVVIEQLYLDCLSQASYLVGDRTTGKAIAVDPRRDIDEILQVAASHGLTIEMVVETHFHADFLSGHLELAAATGAPIGIGAAGTTEFDSVPLADGDVIDLGGVTVAVLATPGHTPESISLVVRAEPAGDPVAVLTGDTLFIGDVGRPDLFAAGDIPAEVLAADLYRSVHRLLELPDAALVLPAHGAGSSCGKALSAETVSTIGVQRSDNYALAPMTEGEFIEVVTEGQPTAPKYFGHDASRNKQERPLFDASAPISALDDEALDAAIQSGAVVVDVRPTEEFAHGHLRGSLQVGLGGRFAEQAGSVVEATTPIVIATDGAPGAEAEAALRLARIGFDQVMGYVDVLDVLARHPDRAGRLSRLTARQYAARVADLGPALQVIDVRNPSEVAADPIPGAANLPLASLVDRMGELDRSRPVVALCAGGARSAIASSALLANGFDDVSDVLGGAGALS